MPIDELEGGAGGESTDTSGSGTGGSEGLDGGADTGADAGGVGPGDGASSDGDGSGGEPEGGGNGPARSMGPGDKIHQAATQAYRKLTGTDTARDKSTGRFQKGPPAPKPAAQPAPQAQAQPPAQRQPGAIDPDRVPDSWTAEAKALWGNLPPRARAEINKREADYRNGHAQLNRQIETTKPHVDLANMLGETATPYLEMFNQRGLDLGAGLKDSIHTMAILNFGDNNQKVALLKRLVQAFKINVSGTAQNAQPGNEQPQNVPPQVQQPQQPQQFRDPRVDTLLAEREQAHQTARAKQIDDFVADPLHEHFQLVYEDMAKLVESRVAPDMQTAYDMAVRVNPAASAATAKKIQEKHAAEAAAAAAEARRAAGVRTGGKPAGGTAPADTKQNRQDVITAGVRAFMQSTGRA